MKNTKLYKEKIHILGEYYVYVLWGDKDKAIKFIRKYTGFKDKLLEKEEFAVFVGKAFTNTIYISVSPKHKEFYSFLSHEAHHAVSEVFDHMGEKSKDEAFAYCLQHIIRTIELKYR